MSRTAPTAHLSPTVRAANHRQTCEIHKLLARNVPVADIAAAVGCAPDRVREVARQPIPVAADDPWTDEQPVTVPTPRVTPETAATHRTAGWTGSADLVLTRACRIDDPRISARLNHILDDLANLAAEISVWDERQQAARLAADADRRAEALRRAYDQRHPGRRATDQQQESA